VWTTEDTRPHEAAKRANSVTDLMTVVGQLTGHAVDLRSVHIAEHDHTSRSHPASHGNAHAADADDRENFSCCHA
jgi:hypothetical protein